MNGYTHIRLRGIFVRDRSGAGRNNMVRETDNPWAAR
jgi:hypothetical protein